MAKKKTPEDVQPEATPAVTTADVIQPHSIDPNPEPQVPQPVSLAPEQAPAGDPLFPVHDDQAAVATSEAPDFTEDDKPMIDAIDGEKLTPSDLQDEPTTADEFNQQPESDHPALAPNGNAIYSDEEVAKPTDSEDLDALPEDTYFEDEEETEEEEEESPFDSEAVRAELEGLNKPELFQKGAEVEVQFGEQPELTGTVQGHQLQDTLTYLVSFQVKPAVIITGSPEETLTLPIPAKFVR